MSSCVLFHLFPLFSSYSGAPFYLFILFRETVMVLIYVVYRRRRESTVRYAGPDDDVRENIIEHEDESGGEDDITATLQIPIGDQGLGLGLGYETMKESKIPWKFVFPLKRPIQFGE